MKWQYAVVEVVWERVNLNPDNGGPSSGYVRAVDGEEVPKIGGQSWDGFDMLRRMGEEGWELVTIDRPADHDLGRTYNTGSHAAVGVPSFYLFKRPHDAELPGARDVWRAALESTTPR